MKKRNYTFSLRKTDTTKFLEFIENQSNFNDSIRILIYKHIKQFGTGNLSDFINKNIEDDNSISK